MLRCSLFITGSVVRVIEFSSLLFASFSARPFILDDSWGKYASILYYHPEALCSGEGDKAVLTLHVFYRTTLPSSLPCAVS